MELTPEQIIASSISNEERISLSVCRPQPSRIPSLRYSVSQPLWKDVTLNNGRAPQRSHQRSNARASIQPSLSRSIVLGQQVHSPLKLHRTTQTDIDRKDQWMLDKQSLVFPGSEVTFCLSGNGSGECPKIFTLREAQSSTSCHCICDENSSHMLGIKYGYSDSVLISKAVQTEVNDQILSERSETKYCLVKTIGENNQIELKETIEQDGEAYHVASQNKNIEPEFDSNVDSNGEISECRRNNSRNVGLYFSESMLRLDAESKPVHDEHESRSNLTHSGRKRRTRFADQYETDSVHESPRGCNVKDSSRSLLARLILGIVKLVLKLLILAFWVGILAIVVSDVTSYGYCVATSSPVLVYEEQLQPKGNTMGDWFRNLLHDGNVVPRLGVNWENMWNGMKMCFNPTVINPWPMSDVFGSEKEGHNFRHPEDWAVIIVQLNEKQ